jgi:large subunit ribosomal protein L3
MIANNKFLSKGSLPRLFFTRHQQLKTIIIGGSNHISTTFNIQCRNYAPKQRKIDLTLQNPFDMLEEYKKKMATIERLEEDTPYMKPIYTDDVILERNIAIYEKLKETGEIPEQELVAEEPQVQQYVDFLKQTKPGPGQYTHQSKRSAVIAVKCGMIPYWDDYFQRVPLTMLWVPDCQVVQVKTVEKEGYTALQLGAQNRSLRHVTKPLIGHFQKHGVPPKHVLVECKVTPDAVLPVGFKFDVRHFMLGQYVDVTARTRGKGFQGPMKRWGFGGQPASHGVSVVHRSHGSTGNRIGKVFPGKKMAGRMGGDQRTTLNLYVQMLDIKRNLIFVKGCVPGPKGGYVLIQDARRKKFDLKSPPPFPSFVPPEDEDVEKLSDMEAMLRAAGVKPPDWNDYGMTTEQIKQLLEGTYQKPAKRQESKVSNKGKK